MKTTDNTALEEKIVERLANGESRDDIILALCENEKMNWSEAEAMLEQVHSEKKNHIVLAQSPLLVLIALALFIVGLGLLGFAASTLSVTLESLIQSAGDGLGVIGNLLYLFSYGAQYLAIGLLGLGMIVGSLRGMQDVWQALFEKLGIF